MHRILEFILAAAVIMSVLVATDYVVRMYVSTSTTTNHFKQFMDSLANAITDYVLCTPGIPSNWSLSIYNVQPPGRVGLSLSNSSLIIDPMKVIRLMVCNKTLNPYYVDPLSNVTGFLRMVSGSEKYGINLVLKNYFGAKLQLVNNSLILNVSKYASGAKVSTLTYLKCYNGVTYYLNISKSVITINSLNNTLITYNPSVCSFVGATAVISKEGVASITYLISNTSLTILPQVDSSLRLILISTTSLPTKTGKYLVNATIFYYVPNSSVPVVDANLSNVGTSSILNLVLGNYTYYFYELLNGASPIHYTPAMHTVVVTVYEKVGKNYNLTKVYVVPLYPYLRELCNGTYGLTPPSAGVPRATVSRSVNVGLFNYVLDVNVWVMRS